MERCLLLKRPLFTTTRPVFSTPGRTFPRTLASARSEDFGLQWKPALRLEESELLADAPYLLRTCGNFDWKAQARELRSQAQISLGRTISTNESPSAKLHVDDFGESWGGQYNGHSWFAAGLTLSTAALVQINFHLDAFAAEEVVQKTEAAEAASRAPSWLTPAFLAFPVVSYAIFYTYRSQVNPDAKVSDWMFGVAAIVIIANLVLISTLGVRLY